MKDIKAGLISAIFTLLLIIGCSGDSGEKQAENFDPVIETAKIDDVLFETAQRWRHGDKSVLYEMEYEYLTEEFSYEKYLEFKNIQGLNSDTVDAFVRKGDVQFFGFDSAFFNVDVVFVGPTGDTTLRPQKWQMFYHNGRWIKPSMSNPAFQVLRDEEKRVADSASAVESDEGW